MTQKFILIPHKYKHITITFGFDLNGLLIEFNVSGDLTPQQHDFIIKKMPVSIEGTKKFDARTFKIEEVPPDLSFQAFWDAYAVKIGKRKMCENIWSKMKEDDRIKAMLYIPVYDQIVSKNGTQKAYPSTYLNQQYYNN